MAFFKDLGKKITDATQDAAKKTSELIEISKLNSAISAEKNAIAELHKKIGVTVYSLYTAGEPIPDALAADVQGISTHVQNITGLENKIADIKEEAEKAKANAQEEKQVPAAPAASAPAEPADTEEAESEKRFCTSCGAPLEPGMVFCGKCGTKNA